jgi:hypothetical protein
MSLVSDIKLIRTDTTLDLSQKAEKGMLLSLPPPVIYSPSLLSTTQTLRDSNQVQLFTSSSKERKTDKSRHTPAL